MQVLVSVFPYEEAAKLCGGALPSYISQVSSVLLLGDFIFLALNAQLANIMDSSSYLDDFSYIIFPF